VRLANLAALVTVASFGCGGDATPPQRTRDRQEPPVTIDAPAAGLVTSERTIVVSGRAPWLPQDDGESTAVVTVNGRPIETFPRRAGYSTPVALELGRNEIVVRGRSEPYEDGKPVTGTARMTVERRRAPGDDTGVLDRATAFMLADSTEEAYWLCGESDDCTVEPVCFALGPRRVDCPVSNFFVDNRRRRCGYVYTLRLRGDRLYAGDYPCRGRFLNPRPERLLRPRLTPRLSRVVIDAGSDQPWFRTEVNAPNRYGAPRFDMASDAFLR
jgi:hypothetical protein